MGATEIVTALVSPAEKLIDTISGAIGKVYEPYYKKKMADAEAYEIEKIGNAIRENCDMPIIYKTDGALQIDTSDYESLIKRTGLRLAFQEVKKQENIESVVDNAYQLLEQEENVLNEPVDNGWIIRFMNSISDISDDDLQLLWSKILAGEVKKPNTYSLRTLDVLKNMSKCEADLFKKISKLITDDFIINDEELTKNYGLNYSDILKLDDCGLINSDGMVSRTISLFDKKAVLQTDDYVFIYHELNKVDKPNITLGAFCLTEAGRSISAILGEKTENNYFLNLCRYIKSQYPSYSFTIHKINEKQGDKISYFLEEIL